jgi:hypothetical protein
MSMLLLPSNGVDLGGRRIIKKRIFDGPNQRPD